MGKRGPAAAPSVLKDLHGRPGHHKVNRAEPKPVVLPSDAAPPEWLTGRAVEIWHQFCPMMTRLKLLTEADQHTFAKYCDVFARWLWCKEELDRRNGGVYTITEIERDENKKVIYDKTTGNPLQRIKYVGQLPQVSIYRNLLKVMQSYEAYFGLNPSSRSSIVVDANVEHSTDPVAAYLFGQAQKQFDDATTIEDPSPTESGEGDFTELSEMANGGEGSG